MWGYIFWQMLQAIGAVVTCHDDLGPYTCIGEYYIP
jgi:hypothetical protein